MFLRRHLGLWLATILLPIAAWAEDHKPTPQEEARAAALPELQQGLKEQLAGNYAEARAHLEAALAKDATLTGVYFQLGVICFNQHESEVAEKYLRQSIQQNEQVAASYNILGVIASQNHKFAEAYDLYKKATEAAPKDPQGFYNWSEALREDQKPKEAAAMLRKALQRNPSEPLYAYKLRIAQIDAGEGADLEAETAQQLKLSPPSGDWLMTAAALELSRGNTAKAGELLDRARQSMSPVLFFGMLQDPYFLRFEETSDIHKFYDVKITPKSPATPAK